jgi:hypothetical protein
VAPGYNPLIAFAVAGEDTTTPFDGSPIATGGAGSIVGDSSITTTHANCFIFAAARMAGTGGDSNPTAGSGWTLVDAGNYVGVEYGIEPSPGTFTSSWTVGAADENGLIMDAIVQAGGAAAPKRAHIAAPVLPFFYA